MTVPNETASAGPYNGNGSTTVFAYGFRILSNTHLRVIKQAANGTQTDLTLTTHYTVSGVGADGGGSVTLLTAPATGEKIIILRNLPFTQETDLENQGAFQAQTVEDSLDLAAMRDQQVREQISRAVVVPPGSPPSDLAALVSGVLALQPIADDLTTLAAIDAEIVQAAGLVPYVSDIETVADNIADIAGLAGQALGFGGTFTGNLDVLGVTPAVAKPTEYLIGTGATNLPTGAAVGDKIEVWPRGGGAFSQYVKTRANVLNNGFRDWSGSAWSGWVNGFSSLGTRGYASALAPSRAAGINDASTISNDGYSRSAAGVSGNPTAGEEFLMFRHKGAGDTAGSIMAIGQTTGDVYVAVRNAGAWGAWTKLLDGGDVSTSSDWTAALTSLADRATINARILALAIPSRSAVQSFNGASALTFSGVSSSANRIEVNMDNLSLSGTDHYLVQLRVGGVTLTSGYRGASSYDANVSAGLITSGFVIQNYASAATFTSGKMILVKKPGTNVWVASHSVSGVVVGSFALGPSGGGSVDAGGVVDGVVFTRTGTNTGDSGEVWIEVFL